MVWRIGRITSNGRQWPVMMPIIIQITIVMLSCFVTDRNSMIMAKEIDSKSDLLEEETMAIPAEHRAYPGDMMAELNDEFGSAFINGNNNKKNMPLSNNKQHPLMQVDPNQNELWPIGRPETSIKAINVKCEKNQMKVNIEFDRPFNGLIFSKGYYSDPKCVHLPAGSGRLQANFEIYLGSCGMASSEKTNNPASSLGMFIENTIIIQYDPQVQEIWDQARKLRCTWYDFYEKAVTFRPFNVDMLDAVTANFLGDNIQCWMQIQVGKGPWASEVAGIVKIGQTMTMVLAIKDEENKFDMLVRNCIAHDGKHTPIQLVDEYGCIMRPKIMSKFQKVKNFGHSATVVSYAYFQAFKFPDSMNVHFQCVIQVCRHDCPPANCDGDGGPLQLENDNRKFLNRIGEIATSSSQSYYNRNNELLMSSTSQTNQSRPSFTINSLGAMPRSLNLNKLRRKRSTSEQTDQEMTDVNTEKVIKVVAPGDVAFALPLTSNPDKLDENIDIRINESINGSNLICMPATGFIISIVLLVMLLLLTTLITVFLVIRLKNITKSPTNKANKPYFTEKHCPKHFNSKYCSCKTTPTTTVTTGASPYFVSMPSIANVS